MAPSSQGKEPPRKAGRFKIFSRTLQDQGKGQSPVFMLAEVRRVYDLYAKKQAVSATRQRAQG